MRSESFRLCFKLCCKKQFLDVEGLITHHPTLPEQATVSTAFRPGATALGSTSESQRNTGRRSSSCSVSYVSKTAISPSANACCAGAIVESTHVTFINLMGIVETFSTVRRIIDLKICSQQYEAMHKDVVQTHVSPSYIMTAPCVRDVLRILMRGCCTTTLHSKKDISDDVLVAFEALPLATANRLSRIHGRASSPFSLVLCTSAFQALFRFSRELSPSSVANGNMNSRDVPP